MIFNFHNQIEMKKQVIEFLQVQLIEKEMINATCGTSDLVQMVDITNL